MSGLKYIDVEGILTTEGWEEYDEIEEGRKEFVSVEEVLKGFAKKDSVPLIVLHSDGLPVADISKMFGRFFNAHEIKDKKTKKKQVEGTFRFFKDDTPEHILRNVKEGKPLKVSFGRWADLTEDMKQVSVMPEHVAIFLEGEPRCPGQQCGINRNSLVELTKKTSPFAGYKDFDDCVAKNQDKDDPDAYCAVIKRETESGRDIKSANEIWEHVKDYISKKSEKSDMNRFREGTESSISLNSDNNKSTEKKEVVKISTEKVSKKDIYNAVSELENNLRNSGKIDDLKAEIKRTEDVKKALENTERDLIDKIAKIGSKQFKLDAQVKDLEKEKEATKKELTKVEAMIDKL